MLRDTLVYDSENWSSYQWFPVVSLFLYLGPSFIGAVISAIKVYKRTNQSQIWYPSRVQACFVIFCLPQTDITNQVRLTRIFQSDCLPVSLKSPLPVSLFVWQTCMSNFGVCLSSSVALSFCRAKVLTIPAFKWRTFSGVGFFLFFVCLYSSCDRILRN